MYKSAFLIEDPGDGLTIVCDRWGGVCNVVTASGSETRILAAPTKAGLSVLIEYDTDTGTQFTLTVNPTSGTCYGYNQANSTAIVFAEAGDWALFRSVKIGLEYAWRLVAQEGTDATFTGGGTVTSETITTLTSTTAGVTTLTATTLKLAVTAVNAAGSVIGNAAALSYGLNVVAGADNTKGVQLPVSAAGGVVFVKSETNAKTLPVYPQVNSSIDTAAANDAVTLGAAALGAGGMFVANNSTNWTHFPIDVT
jgi:hypothetical protein